MSEEFEARDRVGGYHSLPVEHSLPVQHLAGVFSKSRVTASYKYFWLLAILDELRSSRSPSLSFPNLLSNVVERVWLPISQFRLSFGRSDKLPEVVRLLSEVLCLSPKAKREELSAALKLLMAEQPQSKALVALHQRLRFVPYRFLTPWFSTELEGMKDSEKNAEIVRLSSLYFASEERAPLYCFERDEKNKITGIRLSERWYSYCRRHLTILESFCLWHLLQFLEARNPNTPNISTKLNPPASRNLGDGRKHWVFAREQLGGLRCIYSGDELTDTLSIDHFLPWSFVGHDLLWNLVPTSISVNSSKSDSLPSWEYFAAFASLQYEAVQVRLAGVSSERFSKLDDYILLFQLDRLESLKNMTKEEFQDRLELALAPQFQIARNMGFSDGWTFRR